MVPEYTYENFEKITKYPLRKYLATFLSFLDVEQINIINYFNGISKKPDIASFDKLKLLIKESETLNEVIINHANNFTTVDFWELVDVIEDVKIKLQSIDNASKWLRSSITKNNFNPNPELDYILHQRQTLEDVSGNILSSNDRDNDWSDIAMHNDLEEEDYTPGGGNILKLVFENGQSLRLQSVVDNIQGDKVYGLDLQKKLEFSDNDLTVLGYKDTIRQAADILGRLRKGDNPEFPEDGVQSTLAVGSNIGSVTFPSIFRQMFATFATDDTFKSFAITDIKQEQDTVQIEYSVETRRDEIISNGVMIP